MLLVKALDSSVMYLSPVHIQLCFVLVNSEREFFCEVFFRRLILNSFEGFQTDQRLTRAELSQLLDYVVGISEKDEFRLIVDAFLHNPFSVAEIFPSPKVPIILSAREWGVLFKILSRIEMSKAPLIGVKPMVLEVDGDVEPPVLSGQLFPQTGQSRPPAPRAPDSAKLDHLSDLLPVLGPDTRGDTFDNRALKKDLRGFVGGDETRAAYEKAVRDLMVAQQSYDRYLQEKQLLEQLDDFAAIIARYSAALDAIVHTRAKLPSGIPTSIDLAPEWALYKQERQAFLGMLATLAFKTQALGQVSVDFWEPVAQLVRQMPAQSFRQRLATIWQMLALLGNVCASEAETYGMFCRMFLADYSPDTRGQEARLLFRTFMALWQWEVRCPTEFETVPQDVSTAWVKLRTFVAEKDADLTARIVRIIKGPEQR
jgi:hypothetical protein